MRRRFERPPVWSTWGGLLVASWRTLRVGGARLIGLILAFQLLILLLAFPLLGWLFREALRAGGMVAVDFGALRPGGGLAITLTLIVVIGVLAFWITAVQFTLIVVMLRRAHLGLPLGARAVLSDLGRVVRKLWRPSALPLLGYLFVILPLSGFGFTTALAQGISVPPFISGELMKDNLTAIAWTVLMLVFLVLNVRFAITLPIFALTEATGGRALRLSWRLTRGVAVIPLVGSVLTVLVAATLVTVALMVAALVPTAIADEAAPDAAAIVTAFSLGIAQVIGLLLTACVTALIGGILVAYLTRFAERLPEPLTLHAPEPGQGWRIHTRTATILVTTIAVIAALGFGTAAIPTMHRLAEHPDTLVLAHRGFDDGGVENTICGLEAAAAVGADLVEMDVMQTKDGAFVAMHDANLTRLAGENLNVKDLTLAEITALTVRNLAGHECQIPAFRDYVTRAAELGMPLLIEIKLGGADTEDHVARLIAELESLDALTTNIYHSLDAASVAELKTLRPDLTVGYTMAFAGMGVPDTPADFIVVEEWSATAELQNDARHAGLGFLVWTVNEETAMREHLRRDTDGIITDHADLALAAREAIDAETGLADTLIDALQRFVVVF